MRRKELWNMTPQEKAEWQAENRRKSAIIDSAQTYILRYLKEHPETVSSTSVSWGSITGSLGAQSDLMNALNAKASSSDITAAITTHGSNPIAHHSNANDPSADEKAALAGTSGTPGAGNQYVTNSDSRLSDARPPATHASEHVTGGSDVIANAVASGNSGLMSGTDKAKLAGIASGAEVNVNADWDATSGDAQILNKPATMPPSAHDQAASTVIASTTNFNGILTASEDTVQKALEKLDDHSHTGGGGSGESVKTTITQAGHGFSAGDVIRRSSGSYAKAQADTSANAEVAGIVESVDGDDFVMVMAGVITGLSGLTDASVYYLSAATAGLLTATEPDTALYVSKPVLIATGTTTGIVINMRGFSESTADYASLDVMGGRLTYSSTTQITLANFTSNQSRLHNGTNWVTVRKSSEPTLANSANDMGGTALTYGYCYDVFEKYSSATASTMECAIWATDTARYAAWVTSTLYKVGKRVSNSGSYYASAIEHTSGTFATDLAAGKWVLLEGTGAFLGLGIFDGTPVFANSGDWRKYRYIGVMRLYNDSGAKFKNSATQLSLANLYNPRRLSLSKSVDAGGATFTSTSWVLWTNWTSPGVEFVSTGVCDVSFHLRDATVFAVSDAGVYGQAFIDGSSGTVMLGRSAGDFAKLFTIVPVRDHALTGYHYADMKRKQDTTTTNASAHYGAALEVSLWA